ncbi:MAG: metallophosphatase family protein [Actinomycetota bacterium]|nr:metallophosphatase family protein [Actinomycetota bacterium]
MVRSVAVLSDIHGVLPVLNAVLAEPDVVAADLIVVTGDHAAGPQPVPVLVRLTGLGDRSVLVRGNADRELAALARGDTSAVREVCDIDAWAAAQLTAAHTQLLAEMPHPVTLDVDGFGPVLFCHGTPQDDEEVVLVDTRLERWASSSPTSRSRCGPSSAAHHMPFVRLVDRRLVLNPGSIGMPYGRVGGSWALLHDGNVTLRHTPVDVDEAIEQLIAGSTYPTDAPGHATT